MDLVPWEPLREINPWRPFEELSPLRNEMDRLFRTFFGRSPFAEEPGGLQWVPPMDVSETEDSIIIKTELPGLEVKDIDVSLVGDRLTIKGEKKREEGKKSEHFYCTERYCGSFQRSLRLPTTVKTEKIEAKFDRGILVITLPKIEEAKTKEVKIQVK